MGSSSDFNPVKSPFYVTRQVECDFRPPADTGHLPVRGRVRRCRCCLYKA